MKAEIKESSTAIEFVLEDKRIVAYRVSDDKKLGHIEIERDSTNSYVWFYDIGITSREDVRTGVGTRLIGAAVAEFGNRFKIYQVRNGDEMSYCRPEEPWGEGDLCINR